MGEGVKPMSAFVVKKRIVNTKEHKVKCKVTQRKNQATSTPYQVPMLIN
jgi:hypothetical protein